MTKGKIKTFFTVRLLRTSLLLAFLLVCLSFVTPYSHPVYAAAGINHQINFQGKLLNPNGTNVTDGAYSIVFTYYNVASAGSSLWTETQSVTVTNGIFQVNLGSSCSLYIAAACNNNTPVDFNSDSIYLGIKVGADPEMTPRIQFTAVPQAFNSEKLGGLDKTGFIQNSNSLQTANFNISGTGVANTLQAGNFDTSTGVALNFGTTNASSISISKGGVTTTVNGALTSAQLLTGQAGITTSGGAVQLQGNGASTLTTSSGGLTIDTITTAGQTLAIGNSAITHTIQIGTGAAAQTVSLGSTNGASSTTINAGTNGLSLGDSGVANTITIGNTTFSGGQTLNIGSSSAALSNATINIGVGSSATSNSNVTIGSAVGGGTTTLQSSSGTTINSNVGLSNGRTITLNGSAGITYAAASTGNVDFTNTSGTFKTTTGANTLNGNVAIAAGKTFTQNQGSATFKQNAADSFTVQALQAPTSDMVDITNNGFPVATAGINGQQIDYYAALGTSGNEASAQRLNVTNTSATAGTVTNGLRIVATGAVAGTTNGIKIDPFTSGTGGASALYVGTGWKDILSYNGAQLISGTGIMQNAALSSAISYTNLTQVGILTSGSITSFGTINTGNTITGTTINGTTGINTGAGAGTQRIDASGNLSNIGTYNGSGNITTSGGVLTTQGGGNNSLSGTLSVGSTNSNANVDITGSTVNEGATYHYRNLAAYSTTTASITGTAVITLGRTTANTLATIRLTGNNYNSGGMWEVDVSAQITGAAFTINSALISGKAPFTSIRGAFNGTTPILLLGTTASTWVYPDITVTDFIAGYNNLTGWGSGWNIAFVTTEAGYTISSTPTPRVLSDSTNSFIQGGNSFGATGIIGTNDAQNVQIETGGITRFTIDTSGNGVLTGALSSVGLTSTGGITTSGGVVSLTGNVASSFSTSGGLLQIQGAGGVTIDANATAGQTIAIGNSAITHTIKIGTDATTVQTVSIGSTNGASSTTVNAGTGGLTIQTQGTGTLGIGNNAVAQTIAIGNITGATGITQRVGTGNYSLDGVAASTYAIGASTTTGTITIGGTGAQTGAISIGTGTGAQSLNFGTGGTAAKTVTVGSSATTSSTALVSGTGNISLTSNGAAAAVIVKTGINSTNGFQIQNSNAAALLLADTTNMKITVNYGNVAISGLAAPSAAPTFAATSNSSGSLSGSAATTYYYKVSATNGSGESLSSAEGSFNGASFTPISTPGAATAALDATAGVLTGTYSYEVTFVTANGETTGGTASNAVTASAQTIDLSGIPTGPAGTTARKIYRTIAGGSTYLLDTTINDNTTTTLTADNVADGSLGAAVPGANTATTNTNTLSVTFNAVTGATGYKVYRGTVAGSENVYFATATSPLSDTGSAGTAGSVLTNASDGNITASGTYNTNIFSSSNLTFGAASATSIQSASGQSLTLDSGTTGALNIGTNANAKTITIGNATGVTSVVVNCGTGNCTFGSNATAHTTTIGSVTGGSTTQVQAGTGGLTLGNNGVANTIQVGNTTGAVAQTLNFGNNGTAGSTSTVVIGSTVGTSTTTVQSGTGNVNISGNVSIAAGKTFTQNQGSATFKQNAADSFTVQALQAPTSDMVDITNNGFPVATAGINGQQIDYYAALGTSGNEASAQRLNVTNTSATAGTVTNGLRIVATGAVAGTTNGIKIDPFTSGTGGASALYVGTGWKDILSYNGAQLISGTGIMQNAALSSAISYTNLTQVGALTSGSITSFGTINTGNTITGTTINGTTGINTGAGAGTQRIDASGNLSAGYITASGTYNTNTFTSSNLTFGATSAAMVSSANNQNLTIQAPGSGTLTLASGSGSITTTAAINTQAINATGYITTNTSATYSGQWTRLGYCSLGGQYQACRSQATFVSLTDGGSLNRAIIDIRVKQQNPMAGAPYVAVDLTDVSGITKANFVAVPITVSASQTLVELWFQDNSVYQQYAISPLVNSDTYQFTWQSNQAFQTSLPTTYAGMSNTNAVYGTQNLNGLFINDTSIINSSGVLQSAGLSGTYSNALTLSSTSNVYSGASATLTGTVQGGTLNATTSLQTGGTQRIDVSGNYTGGTINGDILTSTALTFSGANPTISASTANTSLSLNANGSGTLNLGNSATANTIQVGNTTGAVAQTLNLGNNATGGSTSTVIVGAATTGSTTTLQSAGVRQTLGANGATIQTSTNSTIAFQIQNASGANVLAADTTNNNITINQGTLYVTDLTSPTITSTAAGANTGGSLSGSGATTYYYKLSALNAAGESIASSEVSRAASTFTALATPGAPTGVAAAGTTMGVGNYLYKVTVVTANGESTGGTESASITTTTNNQNVTLNLPGIPTGATGLKIYRTAVGGATGTETLVTAGGCSGTISTASCTDSATDAQRSGALPASNTARTNLNNIIVNFGTVAGATRYNLYRSTSSGSELLCAGAGYTAITASPFTDNGTACSGTTAPTTSTVDQVGIGTSTPTANLHVAGNVLFKNINDTTTAFQVQNASGSSLFTADTLNNTVTITGVGGQSATIAQIQNTNTITSANTSINTNLNISRSVTNSVAYSSGSSVAPAADSAGLGYLPSTISTAPGQRNTFNMTVSPNSRRYMFVHIYQSSSSTPPTSVTYLNQAMTLLTSTTFGPSSEQLYGLANPAIAPNSTGKVTVQWAANNTTGDAIATAYYNVSSVGTPVSTTGTGTSATSPSIATTTNSLAVDFLSSGSGSPWNANAAQTVNYNYTPDSSSYKSANAPTTTNWTNTSASYSLIAVPLYAVGTNGVTVSSPVASISSTCTSTTANNCTDTGNGLDITQNNTDASGNALFIQNAGYGNALQIGDSTTSANQNIQVNSMGNASLTLNSDTSHSPGGPGGAYVKYTQDGGLTYGYTGMAQNPGFGPDGSVINTGSADGTTNTTYNQFDIGTMSPSGLGFVASSNFIGSATTNGWNLQGKLTNIGIFNSTVAAANASVKFDNASGSQQNIIDISVGGTTRAWIRADYGGNIVINPTSTGKTYLTYDDGINGGVGVIVGKTTGAATGVDLQVRGTGTTCVIGSGTAGTSCTSDARLKTNVMNLGNSLNNVMSLHPITFTWKNPAQSQATQIGFLAQEVMQIFPQSVQMNEDGYYSLDYASLVTPAIGAIQQQQTEINNLSQQASGISAGGSFSNSSVSTGTLSVSGTTNLQGSANVKSDLSVTGATSLSTLITSGDITAGNNLTVTGTISAHDANVANNLTVSGTTTVQDILVSGHIITGGATPTVQLLPAAGSQGSAMTINGNDTSGIITLTTGNPSAAATGSKPAVSGPTLGSLLTLAFNKQFGQGPRIMITGNDAGSVKLLVYPSTVSSNSFSIAAGDAPQPNTTYSFTYYVVQ